jgi:hypothetical protein
LIFPISRKNKFAKIWKTKSPAIENKGNFLARNRRILEKSRRARILQGCRRRAAKRAHDGAISQELCFPGIAYESSRPGAVP